jgi:peroxiredoxin
MGRGGQERIRVSVPVPKGARRIHLRDVLITLGIGLLVLGLVLVFNRPGGSKEGGFVEIVPYTGGLPSGPPPRVGEPAPDFEAVFLDGKRFRLSDYRGKVVWLNFWATWCPPCRAEMPDIEAVWQSEKDKDLMLIAMNYAEDAVTVRRFVENLGLTFPIGLDPTGWIATEYRLAGVPSHFFIDREGILREIKIGALNEKLMRQKLEALRRY